MSLTEGTIQNLALNWAIKLGYTFSVCFTLQVMVNSNLFPIGTFETYMSVIGYGEVPRDAVISVIFTGSVDWERLSTLLNLIHRRGNYENQLQRTGD